MRVIAGTCRSLPLETPKGNDVRPTTDRIKETLFNIINPYLYDCNFLDVCAGSGQIGIEALSRGAKGCVFVEPAKESINCICRNLQFTKLSDKARVINMTAVNSLNKLYTQGEKFDIIFIDPPYNNLIEKEFLEGLSKYDVLADDGFVIVEASRDTDFSYVDELGFNIDREKVYGSNKHMFISKKD